MLRYIEPDQAHTWKRDDVHGLGLPSVVHHLSGDVRASSSPA
ncbi:hypothetical protein [Streptomyces bacillaris]